MPAKRKVMYGQSKAARAARKKRGGFATRKKTGFGYTRTGGFYGRFGRGGELKFFDTTTAFALDATGEVPATGQLNLIPQGVTESTRVGRKCVLKSINIRWQAELVPGAATQQVASTCMIILVLDKQCNGAAAAIGDVLTGTNIVTAQHNLSNSERFRVLKTWRWTMNIGAGVSAAWANVVRQFQYYKKLNIPIEFSSTTGAITEIRSNNLFLLAGTGGQSDDAINMSGLVRVRFSDN